MTEKLSKINLKNPPYHNQLRAVKWELLYKALFPGEPIPSPYEEFGLTFEEEKIVIPQFGKVVAERLRREFGPLAAAVALKHFEEDYVDVKLDIRRRSMELSDHSDVSMISSSSSSDIPMSSVPATGHGHSSRTNTHQTPNGQVGTYSVTTGSPHVYHPTSTAGGYVSSSNASYANAHPGHGVHPRPINQQSQTYQMGIHAQQDPRARFTAPTYAPMPQQSDISSSQGYSARHSSAHYYASQSKNPNPMSWDWDPSNAA